jgi:hypothetical protein
MGFGRGGFGGMGMGGWGEPGRFWRRRRWMGPMGYGGWRRPMGCFPCCSLILAIPLLVLVAGVVLLGVHYL